MSAKKSLFGFIAEELHLRSNVPTDEVLQDEKARLSIYNFLHVPLRLERVSILLFC
jgi:hypothetical protein